MGRYIHYIIYVYRTWGRLSSLSSTTRAAQKSWRGVSPATAKARPWSSAIIHVPALSIFRTRQVRIWYFDLLFKAINDVSGVANKILRQSCPCSLFCVSSSRSAGVLKEARAQRLPLKRCSYSIDDISGVWRIPSEWGMICWWRKEVLSNIEPYSAPNPKHSQHLLLKDGIRRSFVTVHTDSVHTLEKSFSSSMSIWLIVQVQLSIV